MAANQNSPVRWNLRALMADAGMFQTTDLIQPLRDHDVQLSREQVFRLVTRTPERLNIEVLAALCQIFDCGPSELITVKAQHTSTQAEAGGQGSRRDISIGDLPPVRARLHRPDTPNR
ncbi:DNA-binding Xre family transcriptional regulator [Microbacterium sp. AG1240]|nr:DNA-binding Xre family transcriptional regulator [Microbacterium sp. AG1240]